MKQIRSALFAGLTIAAGSTLWSCQCCHGHHDGHRGNCAAEADEQDEGGEMSEKVEGAGQDEDVVEEDIALTAAPEPVRVAFAKFGTPESVKKVERIIEGESKSYEIKYASSGTEASVTLSERGDVMEIEGQAADLPDAVKHAVESGMKGAKIVGAEHVQLSYFEVVVERDGKKHEVKVYANGKIEEEDEK